MTSSRIRAIFILWLTDNHTRVDICDELGLTNATTVNGKTVITKITQSLYDKLLKLQESDKIRLTLKP